MILDLAGSGFDTSSDTMTVTWGKLPALPAAQGFIDAWQMAVLGIE